MTHSLTRLLAGFAARSRRLGEHWNVLGARPPAARMLGRTLLRLRYRLDRLVTRLRALALGVLHLPALLRGRLALPRPGQGVRAAAKTAVIGHRGSPARSVENTLPSMIAAVEDGADAVEIDLCLTKDGQLVLWHDWAPDTPEAIARQLNLERGVLCAPAVPPPWSRYYRPTASLDLAELRTHYGYVKYLLFFFRRRMRAEIPTLQEFLGWLRRQTSVQRVCLDVKAPPVDAASACVIAERLAESLGGLQGVEFVVMSPHLDVVKRLKKLGGRSFSVDVLVRDAQQSAVALAIRENHAYASLGLDMLDDDGTGELLAVAGADILALHRHNASSPRSRVEGLFVWTIDYRRLQELLVGMGVHGILTNVPEQLRRVVDDRHGPR